MRLIVTSAKLAFVATIGPDGAPNVSPKGSVRIYDDGRLIFMDIDSPGTVANLAADSRRRGPTRRAVAADLHFRIVSRPAAARRGRARGGRD
ncbi:pyridoxamine 5'-phosphate oxidase family protein [Nocardia pseudobrasiliensis]|nr:pyridoxamine 5'-phosphate oxidase family protein [Nocardia pseudobrasiliensis]